MIKPRGALSAPGCKGFTLPDSRDALRLTEHLLLEQYRVHRRRYFDKTDAILEVGVITDTERMIEYHEMLRAHRRWWHAYEKLVCCFGRGRRPVGFHAYLARLRAQSIPRSRTDDRTNPPLG